MKYPQITPITQILFIILLLIGATISIYLVRLRFGSARGKKLTPSQENANLIKVLLELDDEARDQLFKLYDTQFGVNAGRYARKTYQKWKAGTVRPNKQTFQRFLINLPRVMSFDLKCEVLREFREAYCPRDHYKLTVATDNWKESLTPLVREIMQKASTAELPELLHQRLSWLAEDDVTVANAILSESQNRQSANALKLLEKEFSNIEHLLDNAPGDARVSHVVKLPLASITLQIKKGNGDG